MPARKKKSDRVKTDDRVVFYGTVIRVGVDKDDFTQISVKLDDVGTPVTVLEQSIERVEE